jgi:hypothetical protein
LPGRIHLPGSLREVSALSTDVYIASPFPRLNLAHSAWHLVGRDIRKVQLLLRHRSIATTEKYLHANVDRLGAVLARKSPLEGRGQRRKRAVAVWGAMHTEELGSWWGGGRGG